VYLKIVPVVKHCYRACIALPFTDEAMRTAHEEGSSATEKGLNKKGELLFL